MQEGEIEKIGAIQQQHLDVRIIAATNQDLETAVRDKRFREDLYYRLNVLPIRMPPLRERPEDIPALAIQFINEFCQQNGVVEKILTDQTLAYLSKQPWPGNVRQLRNMMERVVALVDRQTIEPSDIEEIMQTTPGGGKYLVPDNFQDAKHHFEREYIVGVLNSNKWNILRTANQLGMDRANLYRKMKKLGIEDKRSPKTDVI
jgi:two-component system nitrogen regulation response regulator NtrX